MKKREKIETPNKGIYVLVALALFEILLLLALSLTFVSDRVDAGVGRNVTVRTYLEVGNVYPDIVNITVSPSPFDLSPNSTANLTVYVIARDYNGEAEITNISVTIFDNINSTYAAANDNNYHYQMNCTINESYGDAFEVNATCIFPVWYYAHNSTWNATVYAYDVWGLTSDPNSTTFTINTLLAVGLPDSINYGKVNATTVSDEVEANVTNFGNVAINLSLSGYAVTPGDGWAMNCSAGSLKNISIGYEKFNLNASILGPLSLSQFELNYTNLTSLQINRTYNLALRYNDTFNEASNFTHWRIYVPKGVAGNCSGNIVFGASNRPGS